MVVIPVWNIPRMERNPGSPLQPCELWGLPSTVLKGPIPVLSEIRKKKLKNCET